MALGQEPRDLCGQGNIVWKKRALGVCVCVCVRTRAQWRVNRGSFGSLKPSFMEMCKPVRPPAVAQW